MHVGSPGPRYWRRPQDTNTTKAILAWLMEDARARRNFTRPLARQWKRNTQLHRGRVVQAFRGRMMSFLKPSKDEVKGLRRANWGVIVRRLMTLEGHTKLVFYHD